MSNNTLTLVQEVYFDLCDLITTNRLGGKIQGFHEFETLRDFIEEQRNKLEAIENNIVKQRGEIMTTEIKMHTTIYWEVPEGKTAEEWIAILKSIPKEQALDLATDYGDSEFEQC